MLTMAEQIGQWVSMVQPMLNFGQKVPDLPDLASRREQTRS
jgi:hypothetical protein